MISQDDIKQQIERMQGQLANLLTLVVGEPEAEQPPPSLDRKITLEVVFMADARIKPKTVRDEVENTLQDELYASDNGFIDDECEPLVELSSVKII